MANITLYGVVEIAPAVNTIYDAVASTSSALENTNEVRIYVDTTTATSTINLPAISSYNGIWNVVIWVIDVSGNASGENITIAPDALSGDKICNGLGDTPSVVLNADNAVCRLEIAANGRWYFDGL